MTEPYKSGLSALAKETALYPKEQLLKIKEGNKTLFIGVPKEKSLQENRVSLNPESVAVLVNNGHRVIVERGAGDSANYSDKEYSEAGAEIADSAKETLEADIIMKVEPPTIQEISFIKRGKTLISAFQTGRQTAEFIQELNTKNITAIGYEFIEDKVGGLPLVRAMSEIAGSSVMLIAAEYLNTSNGGKGVIVGGITGVPPTKVVILGAGTVAEYAARAALGLGVDIQIFDNHIYKLRRLKHAIAQPVYTSTIDPGTLATAIKNADVLIGAIRGEKGRTQIVVTEEMIAQMSSGSVVIDVSIDQGGCIETSELTNLRNPVFRKHDIIHYCVPNIASRFPRTATNALGNIFTPTLNQIAEVGGVDDMIFSHKWFMKGVYCYRGALTNVHLARKYNLKYKDLNLLMAARF
ncbi:MAG: alanine dehydrogenase [Cyclobacteriaceae bacterium]